MEILNAARYHAGRHSRHDDVCDIRLCFSLGRKAYTLACRLLEKGLPAIRRPNLVSPHGGLIEIKPLKFIGAQSDFGLDEYQKRRLKPVAWLLRDEDTQMRFYFDIRDNLPSVMKLGAT
jgi:hypothetical protein